MDNMAIASAKEELKKKLQLPKGVDKEIKEDLDEARINCSCDMKIVDGKVKASFNYSTNNDYRSIDKIFNNMDEFTIYAKKFFKLSEK
jgi:hypothetical protein